MNRSPYNHSPSRFPYITCPLPLLPRTTIAFGPERIQLAKNFAQRPTYCRCDFAMKFSGLRVSAAGLDLVPFQRSVPRQDPGEKSPLAARLRHCGRTAVDSVKSPHESRHYPATDPPRGCALQSPDTRQQSETKKVSLDGNFISTATFVASGRWEGPGAGACRQEGWASIPRPSGHGGCKQARGRGPISQIRRAV